MFSEILMDLPIHYVKRNLEAMAGLFKKVLQEILVNFPWHFYFKYPFLWPFKKFSFFLEGLLALSFSCILTVCRADVTFCLCDYLDCMIGMCSLVFSKEQSCFWGLNFVLWHSLFGLVISMCFGCHFPIFLGVMKKRTFSFFFWGRHPGLLKLGYWVCDISGCR